MVDKIPIARFRRVSYAPSKYSERITHGHVKDRRLNNGPNTAFGLGDTPIKDILRMISANKWNIQATIEFEYPVPADSDRSPKP